MARRQTTRRSNPAPAPAPVVEATLAPVDTDAADAVAADAAAVAADTTPAPVTRETMGFAYVNREMATKVRDGVKTKTRTGLLRLERDDMRTSLYSGPTVFSPAFLSWAGAGTNNGGPAVEIRVEVLAPGYDGRIFSIASDYLIGAPSKATDAEGVAKLQERAQAAIKAAERAASRAKEAAERYRASQADADADADATGTDG